MRSDEALIPSEEAADRETPWLHEGLAVACSRRFFGRGIPAEELLQEARAAICLAQARFDPARGCCFSTYAVPVTLGALRAYCRRWMQARADQGELPTLVSLLTDGGSAVPGTDGLPCPGSPLVAARSFEERLLLRDAIRRLGQPYAQVIGLRYFCGMSQRETGQRLRAAQWQVCRWEKVGLVRLRESLGLLPVEASGESLPGCARERTSL